MKWKWQKKVEDGEIIQIFYNGPISPTTFLDILYYMISELRALKNYWGSLMNFWDNWVDTSQYYLNLPPKYNLYGVEFHRQENGRSVVLEIYDRIHTIAIIKFRVYK